MIYLKKKKAVYVQAMLAPFQFRMLHVLIYKTDSVPFILCGCEVGCLRSRKEHRLRVCEGRVVRRIFDVKGGRNRGIQKIT